MLEEVGEAVDPPTDPSDLAQQTRERPMFRALHQRQQHGDEVLPLGLTEAVAKEAEVLTQGVLHNIDLGVINAGAVERSLAHAQALPEEVARIDRQWREKRQRLEDEADLARRRDELVDPANRLVAQTRETEGNDKRVALDAARREDERRQPRAAIASTAAQMREVIAHLPDDWHRGDLAAREKKKGLRCGIERVNRRREAKLIKAEVIWAGGA
jgi:hypothetical protein